MLPASGYPSAGCSSAEPASVSPDILFRLFLKIQKFLFYSGNHFPIQAFLLMP